LYFADHLPFLGQNFSGYKAIQYPIGNGASVEEYLNLYQTPYFIWSNKVAKEQLKKQGIPFLTGKAPQISANYLPAELLLYLGMNNSPYFKYLNEVKNKLPVISDRFYKTSSGIFTEVLNDKDNKVISEYSKLQYYMMFDNE
jgi:hypothetical protein